MAFEVLNFSKISKVIGIRKLSSFDVRNFFYQNNAKPLQNDLKLILNNVFFH